MRVEDSFSHIDVSHSNGSVNSESNSSLTSQDKRVTDVAVHTLKASNQADMTLHVRGGRGLHFPHHGLLP